MNRIDLLIDQIISRAQKTAEGLFQSFAYEVETGLSLTHLSKEDFIKKRLEEIATHEKGIATYYNVRNIDHLRNVLCMDIDLRNWPIKGIANIKGISKDKMYCRKFHIVLWPLFVQAKRIDYLKGMIEPAKYKTGLHSKLSDEQLKSVYTTFKNKYFTTTTEKQFFAAFRPDQLPEGWQLIKWTGTQSHIRYFVKLVSKDYEPEKLKEYITGKTIDSNNQSKYDSLMEKTFLEAIK